jgi:hypothetical protein
MFHASTRKDRNRCRAATTERRISRNSLQGFRERLRNIGDASNTSAAANLSRQNRSSRRAQWNMRKIASEWGKIGTRNRSEVLKRETGGDGERQAFPAGRGPTSRSHSQSNIGADRPNVPSTKKLASWRIAAVGPVVEKTSSLSPRRKHLAETTIVLRQWRSL